MITQHEYNKEVKELALTIQSEALERVNNGDYNDVSDAIHDNLLHETIDGHQWVIYTSYHLPILQYSDNADYLTENIGGAGDILERDGIDALHQALAFWALYGDVCDALHD